VRLKEYFAKNILAKYEIKVPKSILVKKDEKIDLSKINFEELVLKAQVLEGKRGKSGLIIFSKKENLENDIKKLFERCEEVLIEEKVEILKEYYISVFVDTFERRIKFLFSEFGGMDVEELREKAKEFSDTKEIEDLEIREIAEKLLKILKDYDLELVEINPLAKTKNGYVAIDAKMIVDDNSIFRHEEFLELKLKSLKNEAEKIAFENDLHFVDLDGDVGVVGVGAGLTMATIDFIVLNGEKPAFFLDVGGGASVEKMKAALKIIKIRKPKKVIFNIFGGITRCDEIAKAIVEEKLEIPFIIRITGTNEEEAKKILRENGITCIDSIKDVYTNK